jgi:hypothetical protein
VAAKRRKSVKSRRSAKPRRKSISSRLKGAFKKSRVGKKLQRDFDREFPTRPKKQKKFKKGKVNLKPGKITQQKRLAGHTITVRKQTFFGGSTGYFVTIKGPKVNRSDSARSFEKKNEIVKRYEVSALVGRLKPRQKPQKIP